MLSKILYIVYNADGTFLGKLKYGYRKLSSSGSEAACAACDITHGGLSLKESPKWLDTKREIEKHQVKVVQWHRDEVDANLKEFAKNTGLRYPAVLLQDDGDDKSFTTIMTSADLNACRGEPSSLLAALREKDVLPPQAAPPSSL